MLDEKISKFMQTHKVKCTCSCRDILPKQKWKTKKTQWTVETFRGKMCCLLCFVWCSKHRQYWYFICTEAWNIVKLYGVFLCLINLSTNQSINQPINQPTNQSTNQSINQLKYYPVKDCSMRAFIKINWPFVDKSLFRNIKNPGFGLKMLCIML